MSELQQHQPEVPDGPAKRPGNDLIRFQCGNRLAVAESRWGGRGGSGDQSRDHADADAEG